MASNVSCELFPDTPGYCEALVICKRVACVISLVGATFTLTVIVLLKKYKEFTQRLIANLSFASFMFAISFIMSDFDSTSRGLCLTQAVLITYAGWVILLSSMVIMVSLFCDTILQRDLRNLEKHLLITCWMVPLLFAGLPFTDDEYGPAGVWCWIKNHWGWRFGIWYVWKFVSDLIFFIAFIQIWSKLLRKPEERSPEVTPAQRLEVYDDIKTLRVYPIVYFLMFLLPTINRIYNAVEEKQGQRGNSFALLLLHSVTAPMFGAAVALTFLMDKRTRGAVFQRSVADEIKRRWRSMSLIQDMPLQEEQKSCFAFQNSILDIEIDNE